MLDRKLKSQKNLSENQNLFISTPKNHSKTFKHAIV